MGDAHVVLQLGLVRENCNRSSFDTVDVLSLDDQATVQLGRPKVPESIMLDYNDSLIEPRTWWRHSAQSSPECLLRQDFRPRRKATQCNNYAYVPDIPSFTQHKHADNAPDTAVRAIYL